MKSDNSFVKQGIFLSLCVLFLSVTSLSTDIPEDLLITALAGGTSPLSEVSFVQISADGKLFYMKYLPDAIDQDPTDVDSTYLSETTLDQIWQAIQTNQFFSLDEHYADTSIAERTFTKLTIQANGQTHRVTTYNIAVPQFDAIMQAINDLLPESQQLFYDISPVPVIISQSVCERLSLSLNSDKKQSPLFRAIYDRKNSHSSRNEEISLCKAATIFPHPGTIIAHNISFADGIVKGIIKLKSKGGIYGDHVSITVDNTGCETSDHLVAHLFLEFWGKYATPENVAKIKNAIEAYWDGHYNSDGEILDFHVITRADPNATSAPGTHGYHQVKLLGKALSYYVHGYGNINAGTTSATWGTVTENVGVYAHEVGHILHFYDANVFYEQFEPGWWGEVNSGYMMTDNEFALQLIKQYPKQTHAEQLKSLKKLKVGYRMSVTPEGQFDNIMANITGNVLRKHIDNITSKADGILVEIPAGSILLNKGEGSQNYVVTKTEYMWVPCGEIKTLPGIYVACIDHGEGVPSPGNGCDVAPHLSLWKNNEVADYLLQLIDYIDQNDRFCDHDSLPQEIVWRITDNYGLGIAETMQSHEEFLSQAGIDIGDQRFHFPRLLTTNTSANSDLSVPHGLFQVQITPALTLIQPNEPVQLEATFTSLDMTGISTQYQWSLSTPAGSQVSLQNDQTLVVTLTPDIRGEYLVSAIYQVSLPTYSGTELISDTTVATVMVGDQLTETFESGMLNSGMPFHWYTEGDVPWQLSIGGGNSGLYGVGSGMIGINQKSALQATIQLTEPGEISFYYKFLHMGYSNGTFIFYMDDIEMARWTEQTEWEQYAFALESGEHTLVWEVSKTEEYLFSMDYAWLDDIMFPPSLVLSSVPSQKELPRHHQLMQNYPNPFNAETTIDYDVTSKSFVDITLFDIKGRLVLTLIHKQQESGYYSVSLNADHLPSGLYYIRMNAGNDTQWRKIVLLK